MASPDHSTLCSSRQALSPRACLQQRAYPNPDWSGVMRKGESALRPSTRHQCDKSRNPGVKLRRLA
eukprot:6185012-Pleurochrysis_carterae.AAC.1